MNMLKSAIGDGPINWVVQDYRNYAFNLTFKTSETTLAVPIPAKFYSLNSLFMTCRIQTNASCQFSSTDYFFRIRSRTVLTKPPATIPEFLLIFKSNWKR